jgi:hypothetical protein
MESLVSLPAEGLDAAIQIINLAETKGVRLRLLGGLAFKFLCPSANSPSYRRDNKDIDLMGRREDTKGIMKTMETLGYKPREVFNKLNMGQRLIYYDMANKRRVDIFLDEFVMCHRFNFKESILSDTHTLPITQLVMTKLQVVEKTDKEFLDLLASFRDFPVMPAQNAIDGDMMAELCSKDWGMYTTFRKSLESLLTRAAQLSEEDQNMIVPRVKKLISSLDAHPKSLSWRMRATIGEKAKWYDLPESDGDTIFG